MSLATLVLIASAGVLLASVAYALLAAYCVRRFSRRLPRAVRRSPTVAVLKPLCGLDHDLEANLRTYFCQDYSPYRLVFGVRDPCDPALEVVARLRDAFPEREVTVVAEPTLHGTNYKVSNLINMTRATDGEILICADSDVRVGPGWLREVVAEFEDPAVGAVTCLYTGAPSADLPSRLGALFINDWFLPSALLHARFSELAGCFGQTMAVRRTTLEAGGGFESFASHLADDYELGQLVRRQGQRIALSRNVVENVVHEPGFVQHLRHQLRWARTFRLLQPAGYTMSFIAHPAALGIPCGVLIGFATGSGLAGLCALGAGVLARLVLHGTVRGSLSGRRSAGPAWLSLFGDCLELGVWAASHLGRGVHWRGNDFQLETDGTLTDDRVPSGGLGEASAPDGRPATRTRRLDSRDSLFRGE